MAGGIASRGALLKAVTVVSLPGIAVLLALALLDSLPWLHALLAVAVLAGAEVALLRLHFQHLAALKRYLAGLLTATTDKATAPPPSLVGATFLVPELESAITETARTRERRRRELEALMAGNASILANLPDALVMLDRNRRIVRINTAAEALFGSAAAGKPLTAILRHPGALEAAEKAIAGNGETEVDFTLHGEVERHFSARAVPLTPPALDGTVAILALHDQTEARRAEQMRVDFVANASHELRTPLASLLGFIETLRGPARDDAEAQERFLEIMHEQATRMSRLVEDLLSLSRIEMREHTAPDRPVALKEVLNTVVTGLQMKAEGRRIEIELRLESETPVLGDRDELTQVFQNLIDNAIKYGRAGTRVTIAARALDPAADAGARRLGRPAVAVAVSDQGEGIPRGHLPRLTERFYRIDTARSRELGGTGLGLAIVKHIVSRHRGFLSIDSTVGVGSTFTVTLPAAPAVP